MTKLFIDDERLPVDSDAVVVRSSAEAILFIKTHEIPNEIMFDHDLGGDDTTRKFIFWLIDYMLDNNLKFPKGFKYSVHSQNPIGRAWIKGMMDEFIDEVGYNDV